MSREFDNEFHKFSANLDPGSSLVGGTLGSLIFGMTVGKVSPGLRLLPPVIVSHIGLRHRVRPLIVTRVRSFWLPYLPCFSGLSPLGERWTEVQVMINPGLCLVVL